jgi:HK97 family phage major capsid protein/HK97 family phage prohead protease
MKKMELRVSQTKLDSNPDGSLKVSGYVNKTEQPSQVLGATKRFIERIARGAFARAIKNAKEIDFLSEHKADKILASTRNGSLQLTEDSEGLYMEATITPTSWGKDAYELINSGIFKNMSFGFRTVKDSWKQIESNLYERTIQELELYEVSVVKNSAYSQSTIAARSIEIIEEPEIHVEEEKPEEREIPFDVRSKRLQLDILKQEKTVRSMESMSKVLSDSTSLPFVLEREKQKMNGLKAEIEDIKNQMEEIKMTNKTEERDLIKSADGQVQPINAQKVESNIVEKLESTSSAFAKARKVPFIGESMKIPHETDLDDAKFVTAEGNWVPSINLNLGDFGILKPKRAGLEMSVSKQLMYDSGVNLSQYVRNLITRRVAKALEKSILAGTEDYEFKGIAPDPLVNTLDVAANPTIEQLRTIYLGVHEDFIRNGNWYMSRPFFEKVANLKDANGNYHVKNVVVDGKVIPTLFGATIEVSNALENGDTMGQVPVLFASIEHCYTIGVAKDYTLKIVDGDTTHALRGTAGFVGEFYGDGQVTNHQAVAKGIVASL